MRPGAAPVAADRGADDRRGGGGRALDRGAAKGEEADGAVPGKAEGRAGVRQLPAVPDAQPVQARRGPDQSEGLVRALRAETEVTLRRRRQARARRVVAASSDAVRS